MFVPACFQASQFSAGLLEAYGDERQADVAALFEQLGLRAVRYFLEMVYDSQRAPADPVYPPGYSARAFVPGQDEEATLRGHNLAFRDH